jgi:hypothetical protein
MNNNNALVHLKQGGEELVVEAGGKITNAGTQASNIAELEITTDLTGVDTGTDMTAAQAAQIEADLAAIETKLNALIAAAQGVGIIASE